MMSAKNWHKIHGAVLKTLVHVQQKKCAILLKYQSLSTVGGIGICLGMAALVVLTSIFKVFHSLTVK